VLVGFAFGFGRALPISVLAPVAHRRVGRRVVDAMAQRPIVLSVVWRLAAACLVVVAASALVGDAVRRDEARRRDRSERVRHDGRLDVPGRRRRARRGDRGNASCAGTCQHRRPFDRVA